MIKATIVADSLNEFGDRITTMQVTFPRFILAELNTHRMLSRNSASSRAIPFEKLIKSVKENPFVPIAWMKNHKGMQGTEYYTTETCKEAWLDIDRCFGYEQYEYTLAKDYLTAKWLQDAADAVANVENWGTLDVTKQMINRQLEPFMWHTVLITATEWENFFALRCPQYTTPVMGEGFFARSWKDLLKNHSNPENMDKMNAMTQIERLQHNKGQAEIHMMALAEAMWDAKNESVPVQLKAGEWHIPFGSGVDDFKVLTLLQSEWDETNTEWKHAFHSDIQDAKIKIATTMCARISYTVVGEEGKESNYENDIKLHDRLAKSGHWSPFEHCAKAMNFGEYDNSFHKGNSGDGPDFYSNGWSGNFRGFIQYRKTFQNENITK